MPITVPLNAVNADTGEAKTPEETVSDTKDSADTVQAEAQKQADKEGLTKQQKKVAGAVTQHAGQQAGAAFQNDLDMFGTQNQTIMVLFATGGLIFVDHARSGQKQPGNQYVALGVVGFALLFIGEFAPEISFAFAILMLVSTILNSPRGLPFIPQASQSTSSNTPTPTPGVVPAPGQPPITNHGILNLGG